MRKLLADVFLFAAGFIATYLLWQILFRLWG